MALTDKQAAFVREYVKDFNATQAAARAGYSDPNYGRQLITNPNVAEELERINSKAETEAVMTLREVQEWWSNVIRGQEVQTLIDGGAEGSSVVMVPEMKDRLRAASDLAKSLGGFVDRVEHAGGQRIEIAYVNESNDY